QRARRERGGQQAIEDAAAGRGLGEATGVPHDQHPVEARARDGLEREPPANGGGRLFHRRGPATRRARTSGRARKASRHAPALPVAMAPTFSRPRPPRLTGTAHTKPLGATSRPKRPSTASSGWASSSICAVWIASPG